MTIRQDQAVALISALFATECRGVDNDGNEYGPERNAHFLDALRVMYPGIPWPGQMLQPIALPPGHHPEDYRVKRLVERQEKRKKFAAVLRDIAEAFESDDINCPTPGAAAAQKEGGNG